MESTELLTEDGASRGAKGSHQRRFAFIKQRRGHVVAALEPEFARAQAEAPALAAGGTAAEAVRVLRRRSDDPAKIALTEAMLLEIRLGRSALSTLLTLGYLPLLEYILCFATKLVDDDDLRESMVLEAFSEAIADYRGLLANPCRYLHRETLRRYRRAAHRQGRLRGFARAAEVAGSFHHIHAAGS